MMDPAKLERQEEARKLAKRRGIPLVQAHRILQGETTLNEVLKELMRKSRFDRLVNVEGMDPSLAGQVAAGNLTVERARLITEVRKYRTHSVDHDAIKIAFMEKSEVYVDFFASGWRKGRVVAARTYGFDFVADGETDSVAIDKHEVKMLSTADPETFEEVFGANRRVKKLGLEASKEQDDRVRPEMAKLLKLLKSHADVKVTLRDGVTVSGKMKSFSRWDLELAVAEGDAAVTVFFHALHPTSARALK